MLPLIGMGNLRLLPLARVLFVGRFIAMGFGFIAGGFGLVRVIGRPFLRFSFVCIGRLSFGNRFRCLGI